MVIIRTEPKGDANGLNPDENIYDTEEEELELSLLEKSFLDDDEDLESMEGLE